MVLELGGLQAQHVVDEDLAIQIGIGEAIGAVVQLGMLLDLGQAQRVQLGQQVTAHAVGADQHQRADGIQLRLADFDLGGPGGGAGLALVALLRGGGGGSGRLGVDGADDLEITTRPVGALEVLGDGTGVILQVLEELHP